MKLILYLFGHLAPGTISKYFGRLQIVSSSFMAFGHGSNDAQKAMGIITMALFASGCGSDGRRQWTQRPFLCVSISPACSSIERCFDTVDGASARDSTI